MIAKNKRKKSSLKLALIFVHFNQWFSSLTSNYFGEESNEFFENFSRIEF